MIPEASVDSPPVTLDPEDERAFQRVCATTGIPMDVLKASFTNPSSSPTLFESTPVTTLVPSAPSPANATAQPSGTLSFQLNLMDDIDEFSDVFESEALLEEEGAGVAAAWFKE